MRLVYVGTNDEVQVGDEITMKDNQVVKVEYFREPHKAESEGKVSVSMSGCDFQTERYVGTIGAKWIEREDRNWTKPEHAPYDKEPVKKPIEHRLMDLLKERGYEPKLARGADRFWLITFHYEENKIWNISPTDLLCDQWWLV